MAKKKKSKAKRKPEVWCFYRNAWIPLGRSTKKCPSCGADLKLGGHKIRK